MQWNSLSKVDANELQRIINEIKARVNSAQTDIDNAKNMSIESMPGDRFVNAMEVIISISTTNISIDR
jgi:hypothetical protein